MAEKSRKKPQRVAEVVALNRVVNALKEYTQEQKLVALRMALEMVGSK